MKKRSFRDSFGKFSYLNFVYFAAMACYYSFIVAYLVKRGFSSTQIGLVLALNSSVSILTQPLWGFLCDRLHSVRKVYGALMIALAIVVPFVTILPSYALFVFWLPFLVTLFYCSTNALSDAWIIQGIKEMPGKSYGSIRLWGSLGFMIMAAVMGWVSDVFSIEIVFYVFSVLMLIDAVIAFSIRNEGVPTDGQATQKRGRISDIPFAKLFKNYYYVIFIFCAFLLYLPLTAKHNYLVQRVYFAGGNDTLYGFCHSIAAFSEIPVFYFSSNIIRKFNPQRTLKFSMCMYFFQFFSLAFPIPAWGILLVQGVQGLSYGLFLVSSVAYIDALSPVGLKTSALTLATAIYASASGIIGNLLTGVLIDSIGIINVYRYGSIVAATAVLLFFILYRTGKKKHPEPDFSD